MFSENNKSTIHIPINRQQNRKKPIILNGYIWYWACSICEKNAVGRIKCSEFSFAITNPSYKNNKNEIEKVALCEVCIIKFKLDTFQTNNILVNNEGNKYEIVGLERGQYIEQLNTI